MNAIGFALRSLLRDSRSGELRVLLAALVIAVGSVTAIGFFTDRVGQAVRAQAAEVLAADLRLRDTRPLAAARLDAAAAAGLATAETRTFPSVAYVGEVSALATVKAVSDAYPLRGRVRTAPRLLAAEAVTDALPAPGEAWPDTALLARLGADVGDELELGERRLAITRVLTYRPDQSAGFTNLAPSLLMNLADLDSTGLLGEGSRVSHAQLFAGPARTVAGFLESQRESLPETVRIETEGEAGADLEQAIDRSGRFLALASLTSLILAAVAIAMSARRYAERRLDTAALMKSLGASQRFVFGVNLLQLCIVAVVASGIGALFGYASERALVMLLADLLRGDLPAPSLLPVGMGFAVAIILLLGFALPQLGRLKRTPPLRVLRHNLEPAPPSVWVSYGGAVLSLSLLVFWSVRDLTLVTIVIGGTLVVGAALYGAGRGLIALLGRFRSRVGVAWRYGLANVARRGQLSAIQVVAFGLGLMVLLFLTVVRNDLMGTWRATVAEDVPNQFLINIQPHEVDSVRAILDADGLTPPPFVPLVRARLLAINGEDVRERSYPSERGSGFVQREANLTYTAELSSSNTIVAGDWWPADYRGDPQVSVDIEVADDLGLTLGDMLTFNVGGDEITAAYSSARLIEWDSFQPNFFMVLSPGSLDDYAKTFVTSLNVDESRRATMLAVVREHPSVSIIDLGAILEQVRTVIDRASTAVQAVFVFTLGAGLVVLFAAVQTTLDQRRYESALLRTFGATTGTVFSGVATEFLALGIAAGLFAATGATLLGRVSAERLFGLDYSLDPVLWLIGVGGGALLVGISGVVAANSAVSTPPIRTLRRV